MPATVTGAIGAMVDLEIKVTNFTNIEVMQFPITYNSTVLQYVSADGFALPGMAASNINVSNSPSTHLRISWQSNPQTHPTGFTATNGTSIMTLHFKVLASGTSTVNLSSTIPFFGIEIINNAGNQLNVNFQSGGSTVTGGSGGPGPLTGFKIIATPDTVAPNENFCMPVKVNDFTNMLTAQYAMHWNTLQLQYTGVQDFNLPGLDGSKFSTTTNPPGTLFCVWDDPTVQGVTRPNGTTIYKVCFKAIGTSGSMSDITIDGVGFPPNIGGAEAINTNGGNVWTANSGVPATIKIQSAVTPPNPTTVTFTADKDTVLVNGSTCVDVKVKNFNDIVIAQFKMTYDNTKVNLDNPAFQFPTTPLAVSSANLNAGGNTINFSWYDQATVGVTVPDNTTIFSVCFKAIGAAGTSSPFTFTNEEVYQDVNNGQSSTLIANPNYVNGSVYITNVAPPTCAVTVSSIQHVKCFNGTDGAINLSTTGGTPTAYSWAGPQSFTSTQANLTGLKSYANPYRVTVTFAGGCTATAAATVNQPTAAISMPTVTPTPVNCFGGSDGAIAIMASGGTAPYTYKWEGTAPFMATTQNISAVKAGNYKVTITDANGCSLVSGNILVSQQTAISVPTAQLTIVGVKCKGGSDGSISLTPTGGTPGYTYAWAGPNNFTSTQAPPLSNLAAGAYSVTISDTKGCTFVNSSPYSVAAPVNELTVSIVSTSPVKCLGDENGKATINVTGGTPTYTYAWKDANQVQKSTVANPINLAAGAYSLVVTDVNGCTATASATVAGPNSALTAGTPTVTHVKCAGGNNGAISLPISGGWSSNYIVTWTPAIPGGANPTGLAAGIYSPKVKDAEGCEITPPSIQVNAPTAISSVNSTVQQVTCNGAGDGSISIQLTGGTAPYSVIWSNGLSGTTISSLNGGTYVPTVTDAAQCTAVLQGIFVNDPPALAITNAVVVDQNTPNLGSISLTVGGGTAPYSYVWSVPGSGPTLNNLVAGSYSVTVKDINNCSTTGTYIVGVSNPLDAQLVGTSSSCDNNGCAIFYVAPTVGVTKPYVYTWSPGNGLQVSSTDTTKICGLSGGVYNFTITDNAGHVDVVQNVVIQSVTPIAVNSNVENPNEDFKNGKVTLTPVFPNSQYSYLWNIGATTAMISNLDSGLYVVTIHDLATGCSTTQSFQLNRIWQPLVDCQAPEVSRPSCLDSENGAIRVFICGGRKPYKYQWVGASIMPTDVTSIVDELAAGIYNLIVTDSNGTTMSKMFNLTPLSNLSATAAVLSNYNGSEVSGATECDGKVRADATGHVAPLSYIWNNGGTQRTESQLCAGDYWAIVIDGAGCKDTISGTLSSPDAIEINGTAISQFNGFNVKCNGGKEGVIQVKADGGVVPYLIKWSNGFEETLTSSNDDSKQTGLGAGDYSVTIIDGNGVSVTKVITVTEPAPMELEFLDTEPHTFTVCDGKIQAEAVGAAGNVIYTWSSKYHNGTTSVADDLCAGEIVTYLAVDANGCQAVGVDTMDYPDDGCRLFSPIITPGQSDDKNDFLYITCVEEIPNNTLEIYNRWGQLVYQVEGYDNATNVWKGTNKRGQALPEGVYYYVLSFRNQFNDIEQLKGYVNLLK